MKVIAGARNSELKLRCNLHVAQFDGSFEDGALFEFLSSPQDMPESDAGCTESP